VPQVPHEPPQPSSPHCFPLQLGVQLAVTHAPFASHAIGAVHVPQVPPQPSGPQAFPLHAGTQGSWPSAVRKASRAAASHAGSGAPAGMV